MHFADPGQLLAVFSQLEGSNMFQIQTAQDAEAAAEAARAAHAATSARLGGEVAALRRQVADLEGAIATSRERCVRLRAAARHNEEAGGGLLACAGSSSSGASSGGSEAAAEAAGSSKTVTAAALVERLGAAYEAAGFASDASVTPLQMLQKVEARLEELLAAVGPPGSASAAAAEQVERAREKERRQAARAGKLAAQQAEHVSCCGRTRLVALGGCQGAAGNLTVDLDPASSAAAIRRLAPPPPPACCPVTAPSLPLSLQEARVQRVLQRAAAPKFQKQGKPAMTRSLPQRRQQEGAGAERDEGAEEELAAFLALVDESIE